MVLDHLLPRIQQRPSTRLGIHPSTFSLYRRTSLRWLITILLVSLVGCGGGSDEPTIPDPEPPPPPPPPSPSVVSLSIDSTSVNEVENPKVKVSVSLVPVASEPVSIALNFAGTATLDYDYAVDQQTIAVTVSGTGGEATIDVYRDFDDEEDETIEVSLGAITGNAQAGTTNSASLSVIDGPEVRPIEKQDGFFGGLGEDDSFFLPFFARVFSATEEGVQLVIDAFLPDDPNGPGASDLVAELATDPQFQDNVQELGRYRVEPIDLTDFVIPDSYEFLVAKEQLEPNTNYFIRAYLGEKPPLMVFTDSQFGFLFFNGFQTDENGAIVVSCRVSGERVAQGSNDPLFEHQWHLVNTGQSSFSQSSGTPGADLGMSAAINNNLSGENIRLGIVDSGVQICHPDLADNIIAGASYNFAHDKHLGAAIDDPFLFSFMGDHGTSVAGIAASVANNGLGGRGVAPSAKIIGFNPLEEEPIDTASEADLRTAFISSLGGSEDQPNSTAIDIFNMSFGIEERAGNIEEELLRLFQFGTTELRDGRGAVYVKAAGNAYLGCFREHPLADEIGCSGANSEPNQNTHYHIIVGGFSAEDKKADYSSVGSNLWVVGPSGNEPILSPTIVTTDQVGSYAGYSEYEENALKSGHELNPHGDYMSGFGGTSAATPSVVGAAAILLSEKPALTWRDVKHILANTSRQIDPDIAEVRVAHNGSPYISQHAWITNAAGYEFHNWYGFGAVNIDAAVAAAQTHPANGLGEQVESNWFSSTITSDATIAIPENDGEGVTTTVEVSGLPDNANLEAVILSISINHSDMFDLSFSLQSPAGTPSVVNQPYHSALIEVPTVENWNILSNAFYGENPNGTWTIKVADLAAEDTGSLTGVRLRFYYGQHPVN